MRLNDREAILELTREWDGERFPNGRPRVPDGLLERLRLATTEEAWATLGKHGYRHQFEGGWLNVHPERTLVGRAVTAAFVPTRPDLNAAVERWGAANGGVGGQNSWVIDTLEQGDVIVVDLFGKIKDGTFAGDNLGTAIANRTGVGMVINGGIRDYQRLRALPGIGIFCRGVDPTAIAEVSLVALNAPVRLGGVTVLPGDVILGTCSGIIAVPPHLAEEVVTDSELVRLQDEWGQLRLREGRYLPGQVDGAWTEEMHADFAAWRDARG
jgi:4-hydroxy-4-methyl-2-oxoglutarate aldolase